MVASRAAIDSVKTVTDSSYVLTGSKASASINVWTSTLGLNLAGGFNFRKQAYVAQNGLEAVESLYFESLVRVSDTNGAVVLMDKNVASHMEKTLKAADQVKPVVEVPEKPATEASEKPPQASAA